MSSKRVCYSNEDVVTETVAKICDRFRVVIEEQADESAGADVDVAKLTETFKTNFERMLRLNLQIEGTENAAEESGDNPRLEYFSTQVYPKMNSLVVDVAEKRKYYPKRIKDLMDEKRSIDERRLEKSVSTVESDSEDEKNEGLAALEAVMDETANSLSLFNEVAESLNCDMNNYLEAKKCIGELKNFIDNNDHL